MPTERMSQFSFAAGEISPEMEGRPDAREYQNGARRVRNFIVQPSGPVVSRQGFGLVRECKESTGFINLLPFTFSTGDSVAVELGQTYARIHRDGGTILWGASVLAGEQSAGAVDVLSDTIRTAERHGFEDDVPVRFLTTGVDLPGGLARNVTYYTKVVDARVLQFAVTPGGAAVGIGPATNSGVMRIVPTSELPPTLKAPVVTAPADWNPTTNVITAVGHGFVDNDPVTVDTTLTLPAPLLSNFVFYVKRLSADTLQLLNDEDGDVVDFTDAGTGVIRILRYYRRGELLYFADGSTADVWYVRGEFSATDWPTALPNLVVQPQDGALTIWSPFGDEPLLDVRRAHSGDSMALAVANAVPHELIRFGPTWWAFKQILFSSSLPPPVGLTATVNRGARVLITTVLPGTPTGYRFSTPHALATGDVLYIDTVAPSGFGLTAGTYVFVNEVLSATDVRLRNVNGTPVAFTGVAAPFVATCYYSNLSAESEQQYQITSIDALDVESTPSETITASNILAAEGATNTLTWLRVFGARRYRVYKRGETGLFGFIGEIEDGSGASLIVPSLSQNNPFIDTNIGPDLTRTPPRLDDIASSDAFKPEALCNFEQRRVYALNERFWLSKTNTKSDMTYTLPVQDDNRIANGISANEEAHSIRHLVPLGELLALSQSGEWRITANNSVALTPRTVSIRQQSAWGASKVQPVVVNDVVVFAANQGGHLRALSFRWQRQGFGGNDLSLRAAHLFDDYEIRCLAHQKSPTSIVWAVSSSGHLIGLTFIPEEEVLGVHRQETEGTFLRACVVREAAEDAVYAIIERAKSDGSLVRTVERMRTRKERTRFVGLDAHVTNVDTSTTPANNVRMFLDAASSAFGPGAPVTLKTVNDAGAVKVGFARSDVGDRVVIDYDGLRAVVQITAFIDRSQAVGVVVSGVTPAMLRRRHAAWGFARKTFRGFPHFGDGRNVTVVADGKVLTTKTVGDAVTLPMHALDVSVGVPYTPEVELLPIAARDDSAGWGKVRNHVRAWLLLRDTAPGVVIGPNAAALVPVEQLETDDRTNGERRTTLSPEWSDRGTLIIRQTQPAPVTLVAVAVQVAMQ